MGTIKNRRKPLSIFILVLILIANNSAYASNDGQLCDGLGMLFCAPLAVLVSIAPDTTQSSQPKIQKAIKDADLLKLKALLEKNPSAARSYQLLSWALDNYETGTQEEKRAKILTYLLQQIDFVSPSQKNTKFTSTEYYQLAQRLLDDFYVSSHLKKRKYTLQATKLIVSNGFTFHPKTEDIIGEDPRERYAKTIEKFSRAEKELEDAFYTLLMANAPSQTSTTNFNN